MDPTGQTPAEEIVAPRNRKRWAVLLFIATGVALVLLVAGVAMAALIASKLRMAGSLSSGVGERYAVTKLAVSSLPSLVSSSALDNQLLIHGQVEVSSGLTLTPSASAPPSPLTGELYYDQKTNAPYYYNGTAFIALQPAGGVTNNTFNTTNVTNVTNNFISGGGAVGTFVNLQGSSPGTTDTGNFHISGVGMAGSFESFTLDTPSSGVLNVGPGNATSIDLDQPTLVKTTSVSAFQVQDAGSSTVLGVDTSNQFVGINTASPSAALEVDVDNTSSAIPIGLFNQNGTGNATIDLIEPSQGWAVGVNAGNNSAFEINSSTVGAPTIGHTSPGQSNDPGINDTMACNEYVAADSGTALSMTIMTGPSSLPPVSPFDKFSMALYDGNASGPINLIATTIDGTLPANVSTRSSLPITASLTAGKTYWLCVNSNVITSTSYASDTVPGGSYWFHSNVYSNGWPAVAPGGGTNIANFEAVLYLTYKGGPTLSNSLFSMSYLGQARFRNFNDTTNAFQVQNSSGANLLTADTVSGNIILGNDVTPKALTVRGGAAAGNNAVGGAITFDASNGTGAAGSGDFIFRTAAANNPITLDNKARNDNSGVGSTATVSSFTVGSQSNMVMVVGVNAQSGTVSSISWNGSSAGWTKVDSQFCPTLASVGCDAELWYLVNPTSGTHNLVVTVSGQTGSNLIDAGVSTFYNVNTGMPIDGTVKTSGTATTPATSSVSVVSARGQIMVDTFANDPSSTISPLSPQIQLWNDGSSGGSYKIVTDPTTSMNWRVQAADWATVAATLNPASNFTAGTLADRLHIASNGGIGINTSTPQQTLDVRGTANFQTDSTVAFQIQNASGTPLLIADTTNMVLTVQALVINTTLTLGGHLITTGSAPTISAGVAACTTPTVSVVGNDTVGQITVTTGTGCGATGLLSTITFNGAYGAAPHIQLTPRSAVAAGLLAYQTSTTTQFTLNCSNAPADTTTYIFDYFVAD